MITSFTPLMLSKFSHQFGETIQQVQSKSESHRYVTITVQRDNEKHPIYQTIIYAPFYQTLQQIFHPMSWTIENFQIGRHLGLGRFGHVYLARQKKHKHIVALKVLSKKQIQKEQLYSQIRRQIQIHSHLKHQNIVQMFGFFFDQKKLYFILQYAPKGELYAILKKINMFQQERVRKIITQLISALKYIKSQGVIHRDIKPQNILVDQQDRVKLSDFGWSIKSTSNLRKTYCGTYDYLSPEIINNKPYNHNVDTWCLGVLTYQLANGRAPFNSSTIQKIKKNILFSDPEYPPFFSNLLVDFIGVCLKKTLNERITIQQASEHPWIVGNWSQQLQGSFRYKQNKSF